MQNLPMNVEYYDFWQDRDYGDCDYMYWNVPADCPFCGVALQEASCISNEGIETYEEAIKDTENLKSIKPQICPVCQWWQVVQLNIDLMWKSGHSRGIYTQAILKTTGVSDKAIPTDELGRYLSKHPDHVYYIHDKKMEELVAAILREHQNCEVKHVGKSHDRGVDLLLVQSEEITPIQIKRRTQPGKAEGVQVVRELMGVMLREGYKNAMVVTTADRFSPDAHRDVSDLLMSGRADKFELLDYHRFTAMLRETHGGQTKSILWGVPKLMGGKGEFG